MSFTFLEKQTDGSYLELATISKKAEKNYGGGKEDGFYAQAIASAVEQILQSFNTQTKQQINVAAAKIAENPFSNLGNLPIFNTPPKRGLFMTLESLQQNNPDTVQQFMLKPVYQNLDLQSQKKLLYYEIKTPQNKYLKDYPIAFCDGKDVYAAVYKPEEYKLLIDDSNAFYVASLAVENFTKSDRKRNGVGAAASLLFLGVAAIPIIIGTAIANKEGGAEKKAEATDREFDITTGTVQDYPTQKKYENQLLFVYPNNQIDSVSLLTIKIDGKQIVQLSPRSYYIYSMKAEGKPVKITYEYKNEARVFEQSMYSTEINSFVFGFGGTDKRSLYRRDDIVQKPDRDYDFVYQELIVKKKYRLIK